MKKILLQYAAYNVWANQRMTDCVSNLTDEQINQEIVSSFSSIYKTVLHLWDAETIWWNRVKLIESKQWPSLGFEGSIIELSNNLLHQSKQWKEWIDLATDATLEHEFIYRNSKRDQFKQPVFEALQHLFNHQTYHRGQLVTMLRQVGVKKVPNTDMIAFSRKK
ncbi:MAG TPA: DinB family protein [Ferruginibacter sp.]|nr:DinB family protein [Ferruginibacter sp.]